MAVRKRKPAPITPPLPDAPPAPEQPGLECPKCGCRHFYVVRTMQTARSIRRYRECRYCGRRVVTTEQLGLEPKKR